MATGAEDVTAGTGPVDTGPVDTSLLATQQRVARLVWLERRLFEIVGGWVGAAGDAAVKVWFRRCSFVHAERARWWSELLAVSGPAGPGGERGSPAAEDEAVTAGLSELVDDDSRARARAELEATMVEVLSRAIDGLGPPAGGPERRVAVTVRSSLQASLAEDPWARDPGSAPGEALPGLAGWDPWS